MTSAKLTSKGQITIPSDVRRALHLRTGDRLAFDVRPDGTALVRAQKAPLLSLRGFLKPAKRGVTVAQMDEAIARAVRSK